MSWRGVRCRLHYKLTFLLPKDHISAKSSKLLSPVLMYTCRQLLPSGRACASSSPPWLTEAVSLYTYLAPTQPLLGTSYSPLLQ